MEQYIDKNALVTELEKLYDSEYNNTSNLSCGKKIILRNILCFVNTLEVKEVTKKELSYDDYIGFFKEHPNFSDDWGFDETWIFAKHFFELGLKAQKEE